MGNFVGKIGDGWCDIHPQRNRKSFLLSAVLTSVPILVKIDQEMRP